VRWGGLRALERHCSSLLSLHYDYVVYPPTGSTGTRAALDSRLVQFKMLTTYCLSITDRSKLEFTQLRELGIYWDTDYKDMIYALIHANQLRAPGAQQADHLQV
jgi:hypothetical protein